MYKVLPYHPIAHLKGKEKGLVIYITVKKNKEKTSGVSESLVWMNKNDKNSVIDYE